MIDVERSARSGKTVQVHDAAPESRWRSTRERVREAIRAEVDRFNPTEDARRPLELIVESSIRYGDADGEPAITVVDDAGQPRTVTHDGQTAAFTIRDLLEELRATRPMLFKPAQSTAAPADEQPQPAPIRERDWLDLGAGEGASESDPAEPARESGLVHLKGGGARLHLWTRTAHRRWVAPMLAAGASRLHAARSDMPQTLDRARSAWDGIRTPAGGRGLAAGAVALLALLGAGSYLLSDWNRPAAESVRPVAEAPKAVVPVADEADPATETAGTQGAFEEPDTTGSVSNEGTDTASAPRTSGRSLRGVPDVLDTATLSLQGEVVRLFGVEWAPGAGKPEDLTRYLRGREIVCEPAGANDTYRCQVGNQDLSKVVLFNGGGKATADATPELKAAEEKARTSQIGVWRN
ncbi:thermonuclease family protein [Microvirga lenta]|uniref:thermonuclease family protein n=1 Tax=Microvirga lenta TaxID=2881337 RepID=UPI001CFF5D52|nr:hypothetical protein [Microvirga lenta]MCB5174993.1 hypothetical protein [Microvirga lenta]